ncbi:hypothetical protein B0H12DRAFT_1053528, partial [Mycena haematopus]
LLRYVCANVLAKFCRLANLPCLCLVPLSVATCTSGQTGAEHHIKANADWNGVNTLDLLPLPRESISLFPSRCRLFG